MNRTRSQPNPDDPIVTTGQPYDILLRREEARATVMDLVVSLPVAAVNRRLAMAAKAYAAGRRAKVYDTATNMTGFPAEDLDPEYLAAVWSAVHEFCAFEFVLDQISLH